jgi:hypothetical protein
MLPHPAGTPAGGVRAGGHRPAGTPLARFLARPGHFLHHLAELLATAAVHYGPAAGLCSLRP